MSQPAAHFDDDDGDVVDNSTIYCENSTFVGAIEPPTFLENASMIQHQNVAVAAVDGTGGTTANANANANANGTDDNTDATTTTDHEGIIAQSLLKLNIHADDMLGVLLDGIKNEESKRILSQILLNILTEKQTTSTDKQKLCTENRKLLDDFKNLRTNMESLNSKLVESEAENSNLKDRLSNANKSHRNLLKECQSLKEELRISKISMNNLRTKYAHEIRKKENEFYKIQNSAHKSLTDQLKASHIRFKVLNSSTNNYTSTNSRVSSGGGDILNQDLSLALQRKQDEVSGLKNCLKDLFGSVREFIGKQQASADSASDANDRTNAFAQLAKLPFEKSRFELEKAFNVAIEQVKNILNHHSHSILNHSNLLTQADQLKHKVKQLEHVISEQSRLIELSLSNPNKTDLINTPSTAATDSAASAKDLEEEARILRAQKLNLEQDRKKFTEEAIRFGKQKAKFEEERVLFEQEKRAKNKENILKQLPQTPNWLRAELNAIDSARIHRSPEPSSISKPRIYAHQSSKPAQPSEASPFE